MTRFADVPVPDEKDVSAQIFPYLFRGYCVSCGTFDSHGRRCSACGFDFVAVDPPKRQFDEGLFG